MLRRLSIIAMAGAFAVAASDVYISSSNQSSIAFTSVRDLSGAAHPPADTLPPAGTLSWSFDVWQTPIGWLLGTPVALVLVILALLLWWGSINRRALARGEPLPRDGDTDETTADRSAPNTSELRKAVWSCRRALVAAGLFSALVNVLMLTGSLFMLEVYDRVLPSRSVPTLVGLCIIAAILFAALGLLDLIRARLLTRVGMAIDEALASRVFDALVRLPVRFGHRGNSLQPLRDLDAIRSVMAGGGPTVVFDMPWLPFYLAIIFAFHPMLGLTALAGAIVLVALTVATELLVRQPMRDMSVHTASRLGLAEASLRNAEVLAGMGFASRMRSTWLKSNDSAMVSQRRASDTGGGLGALTTHQNFPSFFVDRWNLGVIQRVLPNQRVEIRDYGWWDRGSCRVGLG